MYLIVISNRHLSNSPIYKITKKSNLLSFFKKIISIVAPLSAFSSQLSTLIGSRPSQFGQETGYRLVGCHDILEISVVVTGLTTLLIHIGEMCVDGSIGGVYLQLSIAAIVAQIGHEQVVLEEISDDSQASVKDHIAVHITIHHMRSEVAQSNLAY